MSPKERDGDTKPPADKVAELERQAAEVEKKLAEAEQRAAETLKQAGEKLREVNTEQEATAERLRREVRELLPEAPKPEEDEGEA